MKNMPVTISIFIVFLFQPAIVSADDLADRFYLISRLIHGQQSAKRTDQKHKRMSIQYHPFIEQAAQRWRIHPLLISSIIRHESAFDPNAVSRKGACGLMQLMPQTAKAMGVSAIFDPSQNINGGTRYIRLMQDRYFGDLYTALLAYNAGPGRVDQGHFPAESRLYANKVLHTYNQLRRQSRENQN